jgi:hypothetical protein
MKMQCLGLGLMLGTASFLGAGSAGAKEMAGWQVRGSGAGIVDGQSYNLFNTDQANYLRYGDRWGANYKWEATANNRMKISRKGGGTGPLKCGEVFALFIEKAWVIHERQEYGINLSSREAGPNESHYQWQFSCPAGQTVALNESLTLTSTVTKDALVGCERALGVNVCWANDTVTLRDRNYRKADAPRR